MSDYSLRSQKNDLRKKIRSQMCRLTESQRSGDEAKVHTHVISFLAEKPKGTLLAYAAFPPELNIDTVISHALKNRWRVALPRVTNISTGAMDLHLIDSLEELVTNAMGIREPMAESTRLINPASVDIGFIPAWAYDRNSGVRLGKGGGFYDRMLANQQWRAETYGIAFHCQLHDDLPVAPHDKPVDGVFHPGGVMRPRL